MLQCVSVHCMGGLRPPLMLQCAPVCISSLYGGATSSSYAPVCSSVYQFAVWGGYVLLTQQCVAPLLVGQEAAVHHTHQQGVRDLGGLDPHQEEPRGHVQGVRGQGGQTDASTRLAET